VFRTLTLASLLVIAAVSATAQQSPTELPAAPEGFDWKQLPEINASFLMPRGWHFKHESSDGSDAYFLTLENIEKEGIYKTGLSINSVPQISKKTNKWPKQYAREFHESMKSDTAIHITREWENPQAPFVVYGMEYEKVVSENFTLVVHQLVVANEKTDRLYVILYESSKDIWDAAWSIGDLMMTKFVLDESL
jgi:hypothetical protein